MGRQAESLTYSSNRDLQGAGLAPLLSSSESTWAQMARQVACSFAGSLATAAESRMPARSVSAFQCWSVWVMASRACGGPPSSSFDQAVRSALSQSIACLSDPAAVVAALRVDGGVVRAIL
jgi:hypothetical protein